MNKVITINLGGTAYQLEEGGYDALRAYLETAGARLQGNPDREEILLDIEWAMAEKFRGLLGNHKTVVVTREVTTVLTEMGPIEADPGKAENPAASGTPAGGGTGGFATGGSGAAGATATPPGTPGGRPPKRLYRMPEGAMIAGVCNGLAAYVRVDPTLIRLAFVFLTILWGTGVLVYVVLAVVVPEACTPEEKAAASGMPTTAQEFIRRAREGYYEAIKGFPDRRARRAWQRRFKRGLRANAEQWRYNWHQYWVEHLPFHPGMGLALPLLSLLLGVVAVLWICALVSLLATGGVLGVALPASVPVWVAALCLLVLYGMLVAPLKLARRACYWGIGQAKPAWSLLFLLDALVGFVTVAALLWLAVHHFPDLRDAMHHLPALVHQAVDDIRTWWKSK